MHYLWRAVDHEGEVLEVFATKRRVEAGEATYRTENRSSDAS